MSLQSQNQGRFSEGSRSLSKVVSYSAAGIEVSYLIASFPC